MKTRLAVSLALACSAAHAGLLEGSFQKEAQYAANVAGELLWCAEQSGNGSYRHEAVLLMVAVEDYLDRTGLRWADENQFLSTAMHRVKGIGPEAKPDCASALRLAHVLRTRWDRLK